MLTCLANVRGRTSYCDTLLRGSVNFVHEEFSDTLLCVDVNVLFDAHGLLFLKHVRELLELIFLHARRVVAN